MNEILGVRGLTQSIILGNRHAFPALSYGCATSTFFNDNICKFRGYY
jgi:hypothetical protein